MKEKKYRGFARDKINSVLDLIYPPRCPGCDDISDVRGMYGFCKRCSSQISFIAHKDNICMKCGKVIMDECKEYCEDCENTQHVFWQGKSLYEYSGPIKEGMYRFKYQNRRNHAKVYARDAQKYYDNWIRNIGVDMIVPIPMYERKKIQRGYNQAEEFAKRLSEIYGIKTDSRVIARKKKTKPLKTMSPAQRREALRGAFSCTKKISGIKNVLLTDDIYTTGATMDAVTQVLLDVGVQKVYAITIAIGRTL